MSNKTLLYVVSIIMMMSMYSVQGYITTNLNNTDTDDWVSNTTLESIIADNETGDMYIAGLVGKFGVYNYTTKIFTQLGAGQVSADIWQLEYDKEYQILYLGTSAGQLYLYNITSNTTTNLSDSDIGNWVGTSSINGIALDNTHKLYTSISAGKFGYYDLAINEWVNLTALDTANWMSTSNLRDVCYDDINNLAYIPLVTGKFGVYNVSANVISDLSATDTANWVSTTTVNRVLCLNGNVYTGLQSGKFGLYDSTTGVWSDLSTSDTDNWMTGTLNGVRYGYDASNNLIYTSMSAGQLGVYDITTNVFKDLSSSDVDNWMGTANLWRGTVNPIDNNYYVVGDAGRFGVYESVTPVCVSNCEVNLTSCNTTLQSGYTYTLQNDVTASGTYCYAFYNVVDTVFDCNNYMITSTATTPFHISQGVNNLTLQNCNVNITGTSLTVVSNDGAQGSDVTITNFNVYADGFGLSLTPRVVDFKRIDTATMDNINAYNFAHGIRLTSLTNPVINNTLFDTTYGNALRLQNVTDSVINNVTITKPATMYQSQSVLFNISTNILLSNNNFLVGTTESVPATFTYFGLLTSTINETSYNNKGWYSYDTTTDTINASIMYPIASAHAYYNGTEGGYDDTFTIFNASQQYYYNNQGVPSEPVVYTITRIETDTGCPYTDTFATSYYYNTTQFLNDEQMQNLNIVQNFNSTMVSIELFDENMTHVFTDGLGIRNAGCHYYGVYGSDFTCDGCTNYYPIDITRPTNTTFYMYINYTLPNGSSLLSDLIYTNVYTESCAIVSVEILEPVNNSIVTEVPNITIHSVWNEWCTGVEKDVCYYTNSNSCVICMGETTGNFTYSNDFNFTAVPQYNPSYPASCPTNWSVGINTIDLIETYGTTEMYQLLNYINYNINLTNNCIENWVSNDTTCNGVNYTIQYYDANSCGTNTSKPVDDGLVVSCTSPPTGLAGYNQQLQNEVQQFFIPIMICVFILIALISFMVIVNPTLEKYQLNIVAGVVILLIMIIVLMLVPALSMLG